jgi:hypothetical protein
MLEIEKMGHPDLLLPTTNIWLYELMPARVMFKPSDFESHYIANMVYLY